MFFSRASSAADLGGGAGAAAGAGMGGGQLDDNGGEGRARSGHLLLVREVRVVRIGGSWLLCLHCGDSLCFLSWVPCCCVDTVGERRERLPFGGCLLLTETCERAGVRRPDSETTVCSLRDSHLGGVSTKPSLLARRGSAGAVEAVEAVEEGRGAPQ